MPVNPPQVKKAQIYPVPKPATGAITVHFNPTTLVYSVENSTPQQAGDPNKRQQAAQFSAKLTMDLQFDTTDSGVDVRGDTRKIASFLNPTDAKQQNSAFGSDASSTVNNAKTPAKAPPVICFEWGSYTFQGVLETFRETIDFFSAEGVPLRALVSIGMARQDKVFEDAPSSSSASQAGSLVPTGVGTQLQSLISSLGGNPAGARQLAARNGLDSTRFTNGSTLQISSAPQLNAAASFSPPASSGSGLGLSLGGSSGGGAAIGIGTSASGSLGAQFGSGASAGVPATAGAFAGLQTGTGGASTAALVNVDMSTLLGPASASDVNTSSGASYSPGGAAADTSGAAGTADVGVSYSFSSALMFDNED